MTLLLVICGASECVMAQDIIVLRESEEIIKCKIIEINDTIVSYSLLPVSENEIVTVARFTVESYSIGKRSALKKQDQNESNDDGILYKYKAGEIRKGFIVFVNGDTLFGRIKIRDIAFNQIQVMWLVENDSIVIYTPKELKSYGYDLINYQVVDIDYKKEITAGIKCSGKLFLEHLDQGAARLYQFVRIIYPKSVLMEYSQPPVYYGSVEIEYYIIPPVKEPRVVQKKSVRGSLIRLFEDHDALVEEMINNRPRMEDVPSVVSKYNYWYENVRTSK